MSTSQSLLGPKNGQRGGFVLLMVGIVACILVLRIAGVLPLKKAAITDEEYSTYDTELRYFEDHAACGQTFDGTDLAYLEKRLNSKMIRFPKDQRSRELWDRLKRLPVREVSTDPPAQKANSQDSAD